MAQYKVPQDVEAEDKLLGPFTFRQFIYLMVTAGLIGLGFALFQIFPLLAIIPVPFALFFGVLALPLKRDQPMETYLAAVVSYHLKPKNKYWMPGQRNTTVLITAPKQIEESRSRDISSEEAGHRLSFLANVIDTEGYAIRDASNMKDEFVDEANAVTDILDEHSSTAINNMLYQEKENRRNEIVDKMRMAINNAESIQAQLPQVQQTTQQPYLQNQYPIPQQAQYQQQYQQQYQTQYQYPQYQQPVFQQPQSPFQQVQQYQQQPQQYSQPQAIPQPQPQPQQSRQQQYQTTQIPQQATQQNFQPSPYQNIRQQSQQSTQPLQPAQPQQNTTQPTVSPRHTRTKINTESGPHKVIAKPQTTETTKEEHRIKAPKEFKTLAEDKELSVETIQKQANRIKNQKSSDDEVFISLH